MQPIDWIGWGTPSPPSPSIGRPTLHRLRRGCRASASSSITTSQLISENPLPHLFMHPQICAVQPCIFLLPGKASTRPPPVFSAAPQTLHPCRLLRGPGSRTSPTATAWTLCVSSWVCPGSLRLQFASSAGWRCAGLAGGSRRACPSGTVCTSRGVRSWASGPAPNQAASWGGALPQPPTLVLEAHTHSLRRAHDCAAGGQRRVL